MSISEPLCFLFFHTLNKKYIYIYIDVSPFHLDLLVKTAEAADRIYSLVPLRG